MVDKISSWKYAEEFALESEALRVARLRAEEFDVETITAATGSALAVLAASLSAKTIVEAGTGCGISGLWLLAGAPNAVLATIDTEPDRQAAARTAFSDAGIAANRSLETGGRVLLADLVADVPRPDYTPMPRRDTALPMPARSI
jgi:predicted O-methyltransferase YrrM